MNYSSNQLTVFKEIKDGNSNVAIKATAGAGKTTTILACLDFTPKTKKSVFLSFSKAIVDELKEKVPQHIQAATLHSLGFSMMRSYLKGYKIKVEPDKYAKLAINYYKKAKGDGPLDKKEFRSAFICADICTYIRMTLTPQTLEDVAAMCMYYNIDFDKEMLECSLALMKDSLKMPKNMMIDFADMIYYPSMIPEMVNLKYDYVYLDEAQDTNKAQFKLIELILAPNGRLISVGDDYQCIYGFSGADVDAFKRIRERPNTITLPLNVSYRCPKLIVKEANQVCPEMEAYENNEEGVVDTGDWNLIEEGDMVLSRVTRPLISLYFKLLDKGVKAKVIGKDIEQGLLSLIEDTMSNTFEGMIYEINLKRGQLENELRELGIRMPSEHPKMGAFEEKIQVINLLMKKVNSPTQLIELVKEIFKEDKKAARLMTIHRSKGLEANRVFLITHASEQPLMPSKWAKQSWEFVQEDNLKFVALTRAKKELIFISLTDI